QIAEFREELNSIEKSLTSVQEELEEENEDLNYVIDEIKTMDDTLKNVQSESNKIQQFIEDVEKEVKEQIDFDGVPTDELDQFVTTYTEEIEPTLRSEITQAKKTLEDAKRDRKSTRLNSSHVSISYAVFCLKKKNTGS